MATWGKKDHEELMKSVEENLKNFEELDKHYQSILPTYDSQPPEVQRWLDSWKGYREVMLEMKEAFEARKHPH